MFRGGVKYLFQSSNKEMCQVFCIAKPDFYCKTLYGGINCTCLTFCTMFLMNEDQNNISLVKFSVNKGIDYVKLCVSFDDILYLTY